MMSLKRSRLRQSDDDLDPMSSISNMTDLMLVLAVGFLIFAVMSTGMEEMIQNQQNQSLETVEIEPGQEITEQLEHIDSSSSGYTKTGTVYTDPKTGKLYMASV